MLKNKFNKIVSIFVMFLIFFQVLLGNFVKIGPFYNVSIASEENGVIVDKYVVPNGSSSNEFILTLEAYLVGDADEIVINKVNVPTDIVLVVDQSTSMKENNLGSKTRLEAMRSAVKTFANDVYNQAHGDDGVLGTTDDVNHRMAIVGFGQSNPTKNLYENTELFIGSTEYNYLNLTPEIYAQAFQDMNTTSGKNNIDSSINKLDGYRATFVDKGVEMANGILANNPIAEGERRNRVVIIIMDGQPGSYGRWGYDEYGKNGNDGTTVANITLPLTYATKNTYGADVYTVGVFGTADCTIPAPQPNWSDGKTSDSKKDNAFMHYMSSNFKNATSVENPGEPTYPATGNYYMSVLNTTQLTAVFESIYEENIISKGTILDEKTVLKDIISSQFELPENVTTSDIKVYTSEYLGNGNFTDRVVCEDPSIYVSIYKDENTGLDVIDITGFNYDENAVFDGTLPTGTKLIVEIPIVASSSNTGGIIQETNDALSGIYTGSGEVVEDFLVESFPVPAVDVPTTVTLKHVFEGVNIEDAKGIELSSNYLEFKEYLEVENEKGNYLKALGESVNSTNSLGNNETITFDEVVVDNTFKVSGNIEKGYEITKVIVESPTVEAYEIAPDENGDYLIDVINDMNITFYTTRSKREITVIKQWEDANNKKGTRPNSIMIELLQNNTLLQEVEIGEDNNWQYTFSELELYDENNNEYNYEIKEKDIIDGYYIRDITLEDDIYTIINSKFGSVTITKEDNVTGEKLENAKFELQIKNHLNEWETIANLVTDSEGQAYINNLIFGTYRLTEIKAPPGHNLSLEADIEFEVNSSQMDYEFTVTNRSQMILPHTGSRNVFIMTSIILILIILWNNKDRTVFVVKKKRKSRISESIKKK